MKIENKSGDVAPKTSPARSKKMPAEIAAAPSVRERETDGDTTGGDNTSKKMLPDAKASLLSELLLFHAALGRGYVSPFPVAEGLVFSTALPQQALKSLSSAEVMFRKYHDDSLADDRRALAEAEEQQYNMRGINGMNKEKIKEIKKKLSRRPHVTWREDQVVKSTLVELLKTHYYGAFTYIDAAGSRLGYSLCFHAKLASDLGWTTLMGGASNTEEAFIRSNGTGGANIHSLNGLSSVFNYFCCCTKMQMDTLRKKVKKTSGGQVGLGKTITIPGYSVAYSGVTSDVLYSLMLRVFARGEKPEEQRVKVSFAKECESGWQQFLAWELKDLIEMEDPPVWQVNREVEAIASAVVSVLFGARAALTAAFIEAASRDEHGHLNEVELNSSHLHLAQEFARFIYVESSGLKGISDRIKHLKNPRDTFITEHKLRTAKIALEDAIKSAPGNKIPRTKVLREVDGVTLGLLDELVKRGEIHELCGTEECRMGKTTRAYTLTSLAPAGNPEEALAEYEEACQDFAEHPDVFPDSEAIKAVSRIRERAAEIYEDHFLPMVPLSRLSKEERRQLPKLLQMYPQSLLLRGDACDLPEPEILDNDEDVPFDRGGLNLWVRYRPDGKPFCDWQVAGKLKLGDRWDDSGPDEVPS